MGVISDTVSGASDVLLGTRPSVSTGALPTMTPEQEAQYMAFLEKLLAGEGPGAGYDDTGRETIEGIIAALSGGAPQVTAPGAVEVGDVTAERIGDDVIAEKGQIGEFTLQALRRLGTTAERTPEQLDALVQQAVIDPTLRQLHRDVLPGLSREAVASGGAFYGSGRLEQEGRALGEASSRIGEEGARIRQASFESGQQRSLQAALGMGTMETGAQDMANRFALGQQGGRIEIGRANQGASLAAALQTQDLRYQSGAAAAGYDYSADVANQDAWMNVQQLLGGIGIDLANLGAGEQQLIAALFGIPTQSPYAVSSPGSTGVAQALAGGASSAAGAYYGAKAS